MRKTLFECPNCKLPLSTELSAYRGMGMIQVGLYFEFDDDLRSSAYPSNYSNNHIFADLLVPLSSKFKSPLVFWLDQSFPTGVNYKVHERPEKKALVAVRKALC